LEHPTQPQIKHRQAPFLADKTTMVLAKPISSNNLNLVFLAIPHRNPLPRSAQVTVNHQDSELAVIAVSISDRLVLNR